MRFPFKPPENGGVGGLEKGHPLLRGTSLKSGGRKVAQTDFLLKKNFPL